jgi:hypothetical protein
MGKRCMADEDTAQDRCGNITTIFSGRYYAYLQLNGVQRFSSWVLDATFLCLLATSMSVIGDLSGSHHHQRVAVDTYLGVKLIPNG